jgi:hypothetical protein
MPNGEYRLQRSEVRAELAEIVESVEGAGCIQLVNRSLR